MVARGCGEGALGRDRLMDAGFSCGQMKMLGTRQEVAVAQHVSVLSTTELITLKLVIFASSQDGGVSTQHCASLHNQKKDNNLKTKNNQK